MKPKFIINNMMPTTKLKDCRVNYLIFLIKRSQREKITLSSKQMPGDKPNSNMKNSLMLAI